MRKARWSVYWGAGPWRESSPGMNCRTLGGGRQALIEGLERAGLSESRLLQAQREPASLAAYLEVHIEQSSRLTLAGADVGLVTTIAGIRAVSLSFIGQADHAGTTSMEDRRDAGLGAADFILAARNEVRESFTDCVLNVGHIQVSPGALNIVPEQVDLAVEFRAPDLETLQRLSPRVIDIARESASSYGLEVVTDILGTIQPTPCDPGILESFQAACDLLGLRAMPLASGAGHDTMAMAQICPAGMIFIPSQGGSHSPREYARWSDCVNGANVLLQTVVKLQERGSVGTN